MFVISSEILLFDSFIIIYYYLLLFIIKVKKINQFLVNEALRKAFE